MGYEMSCKSFVNLEIRAILFKQINRIKRLTRFLKNFALLKFKENKMQTAKLSVNQQNQVVELPPLFQFEGTEVIIKRLGEGILLLPLKHSAAQLRALLESIDESVELKRNQPFNNDTRDFE
jgi:antitoxin VapB